MNSHPNPPRVLLLRLSERRSEKGRIYRSGWHGQAKVVGFKSEEQDKYGNEQWEIFVSTPEPRPAE
jgi:hypothetical protein